MGKISILLGFPKRSLGLRITRRMRAFHEWLRDCGLVGPLRSEPFTSSNMQETPVCKRLDKFWISMEWVPILSRKYYGRLFMTIVHHVGDKIQV